MKKPPCIIYQSFQTLCQCDQPCVPSGAEAVYQYIIFFGAGVWEQQAQRTLFYRSA